MSAILEIDGIRFTYPHSEREILSGCSLTVEEGELVSILGPNGAGKSTLLNCACGLLTPQSGTVCLEGRSVRTMEQRDVARVIGYVQQTQQSVFPHTVFDYVLMGRACRIGIFEKPSAADREKVAEVLERMGIARLADCAVTEISGGERQQAAIARAVVQDPRIIFFDEPTAHLDYGNQIKTLRLVSQLREQGFAVLMTTHNPDHCMMLGGRAAILDRDGTLDAGPVEEVINEQRLREVYGTELKLTYVEAVGRVTCVPVGL